MKLRIPVQVDNGLDSKVSLHFGSAPFFLLLDSETAHFEILKNSDEHHAHSMCHPVGALNAASVVGVVAGGIGRAIEGLNAAGIKVYRDAEGSARQVLDAAPHNTLEEMTPDAARAGHGEQGCSSH